MITVFSLCFGSGILFILLSIPLVKRKVPQNSWYGVRVGETMANEEVWYETNAAAGKEMIVLGLLVIAQATLLLLIPNLSVDTYGLIQAVSLMAGVLTLAFRSLSFARNSLARITGSKKPTQNQR